jgi:hypothetical protein
MAGRRRKGHSSLQQHARIKRRLVPPLQKMAETGKVQLSNWIDDRVPDVLWLAIIRVSLDRDSALGVFRQLIEDFEYGGDVRPPIPTRTFLGSLSSVEFDQYMRSILSNEHICKALGALLIFEDLPDRSHWMRHVLINGNSFGVVADAVSACFDHQSQESTDIRWFSISCMARNGRIVLANSPRFREVAREFQEYPNYGDQRKVRPLIRAMEIGTRREDGLPPPKWCADFWRTCWKRTKCVAGERSIVMKNRKLASLDTSRLEARIQELYWALTDHFFSSSENTNLDARRDSTFGLALYALYQAFECIVTGAHERAIGQSIVRTVAEVALTLEGHL